VSLASQLVLVGGVAADQPQPDGASEVANANRTDGLSPATIVTPSIYWGAYVSGWPDSARSLDAFEQHIGRRMAIVHWGEPWFSSSQPQGFPTLYFETIRRRGSIPLLDWGSWDTCCDAVDQPDFQLQAIASGAYDDFITSWAQDAAKWGNPFFLRFDHEMTGWWYPWGEQVNGNQPGDFVAAWQHVHDIFVQQGATNATWVWCPNAVGKSTTALAEVYPGDDYVDWTCLDSYNFGTDGGNLWISFKEAFNGSIAYGTRDSYSQLVNLAPTKPIMIGETASSENGGSKAAWITDMLEAELPNQFPQVKALVWFDSSGIEWGRTFPLDSSPAATRAFQSGIASPVYASNAYATLEVSPIPAPEYLVPKP
jgi:hypothetical protein